jgi:transposase
LAERDSRILRLEGDLERERGKVKNLAAAGARLESELDRERARANKLASMIFGLKSERLKLSDIKLDGDCVVAESAAAKAAPAERGSAKVEPPSESGQDAGTAAKGKRGAKPGHPGAGRKIPDNLPVEDVKIELTEAERACGKCGGVRPEMPGLEEVSYQITVRKQYVLRRFVRATYGTACACEGQAAIITAPPAPRLIPKGKFSELIWAEFLIGKFMTHTPVNRQLFEMNQAGFNIKSGAVLNGLEKIFNEHLEPLQAVLLSELRLSGRWHADETRWRMFLGGSESWYMWGYRSPEIVAFVLEPTRGAVAPLKTLFGLDIEEVESKDFRPDVLPPEGEPGAKKMLNVDRYSAYKTLQRLGLVLLAYCWAHARRDFVDLQKKYPGYRALYDWAGKWLLRIAEIYKINDERVNHPKGSKLFLEWDAKLRSALKAARAALDGKPTSDAQKKVMDSMKEHWEGLTLFVDHPELPMDNNLMEGSLRPCALGRNNFLGSRSEWSGKLAACMYSIIQTCLVNGIEPKAYLLYYFSVRMARKDMGDDDLRTLLPHNLADDLKEKLKLKKF